MEKSTQNNLCRGLRACGIPKKQAHQILNIVQKWDRENGPEWTVKRIKALRQWYETSLSGKPEPPEWFKHSKTGLPVGIWGWVFRLPVAKALGVLSCSTVYYEHTVSEAQKEKFLHGIHGNSRQDWQKLEALLEGTRHFRKGSKTYVIQKLPPVMPNMKLPTLFDMNGSCPVHEGKRTKRANGDIGKALEILKESWESVPQPTFDFLLDQDKLDWLPIEVAGNSYQLELNRPHTKIVGRISVIQEPELKARIVANPNRVVQVTLDPLRKVYMATVRHLRSSCIFDQESGMEWVRNQLQEGTTLAGSDLTSASDLIDLDASLNLVDRVFGFSRISGYQEYVDYFREVSRSEWACSFLDKPVRWEQGDPLGTVPSIGLLDLTNAAAAIVAVERVWNRSQLPSSVNEDDLTMHWSVDRVLDQFRTIGDDMILKSEFSDEYSKVIECLGGEVNYSKTLISDKVAEFAGRVITRDQVFLKKVNYSEPSDNSFMSYMAQLGDQAKYFLRPKQREVYDLLKEVPGIVIDGPWMRDSYGVPLDLRYQWYLEEVEPALGRAEPDIQLKQYGLLLLKATYVAQTEGIPVDAEHQLPWPMEESYLDSLVQESFRLGGDPRLVDGKTLLEVLHKLLDAGTITPFSSWLEQTHPGLAERQFRCAESTPANEQDDPNRTTGSSRGEER
jgi:hypothetical protein